MKRIITSALIVTVMATPASALALPIATFDHKTPAFTLKVTETPTPAKIASDPKPADTKPSEPAPAPQPVVYTVVEGDNLTKIGSAHSVEWQRLWAKNTQLIHPDKLNIGERLTIPLADEALSRELPAVVSLPVATPGVEPYQAPKAAQPAPALAPAPARASYSYDASNTYGEGYCTWYVKNRRGASLPNSLGNANTWYYRAAAMGMAVGSEPAVGAVGTTTRGSLGHVVYVERVNGDGTIYISEMNYAGLYSQRTRLAQASEFSYIY